MQAFDMNIQNNSPEFVRPLKEFKKNPLPWRWGAFVLLLLPACFQAQTLQGFIRDADNGQALGGATVVLHFEPTGKKNAQGPFERNTNSDGEGKFRLEGLVPGYYRAAISAPEYETQTLLEVSVAAGKEQALTIALRRSPMALPAVTISADPDGRRRQQVLAEIPLTREQTLRFPVTFFDPARLAMAYPGVANNDDQANGLIVRGNNPASLRWRLEGVDVVNPNHQSNAGTFSDRPAAAAGGVLMFSAQLLDNSALLTGSFPAGYGDATGGVMDMYLRRGNAQQREFTAQLGLIGLDVAAEGPLNKKKNSAYLANYRYSTVGLLGKMGVSFGNEEIDFQDFSFKLSYSDRRGGEWSFFGLGGLSRNLFKPVSDSADIKKYKDFFNIDFGSRTGVVGLSYSGLLGNQTRFRWSAVWSGQDSRRDATGLGLLDEDEQMESRSGLSFSLFRKLNSQNRVSAGALSQLINYSGTALSNGTLRYSGDVGMLTLQPWANWEWRSANERWSTQVGVHSNIVDYTSGLGSISPTVEPRLSIGWRPDAEQRVTLAYGYHSQLNPLWYLGEQNLGTPGRDDAFHRNQGLVRAHHLGLKYARTLHDHWQFKTELFWQWLMDIPVADLTPSTLSLLNVSELQSFPRLRAEGTGENKGIECSLERYFTKGWFMAANTTLFRSQYTDLAGQTLSTRWDLGHIANLTAGKEWMTRTKRERHRRFGINARLVWAGGQRTMPVDAEASALNQTTVFITDQGFTVRQSDFFRLDLRIYWKRSLGDRRNSTFALDFQNATMQENTAYQYYDPFTKKVETKYQLGLIPNLSWRIEF